jgi:hypothetical protein
MTTRPTTTGQRPDSNAGNVFAPGINNKATAILVIVILLLIGWAIILGLTAATNTHANAIEKYLCNGKLDLHCDDFNPCTLDVIEPVSCYDDGQQHRLVPPPCQSYKCKHYPLATGSCCTFSDFCYYDAPYKRCTWGTCAPQNTSLCKGFCNTAADCQIPLNLTTTNQETFCFFNSCITQTVLNPYWLIADPYTLLNTSGGSRVAMATQSCLSAVCQPMGETINSTGYNLCLFSWTCAPLIGVSSPDGVKRTELVAPATRKTRLHFDLPGMNSGELHVAFNLLVEEQALKMVAQLNAQK